MDLAHSSLIETTFLPPQTLSAHAWAACRKGAGLYYASTMTIGLNQIDPSTDADADPRGESVQVSTTESFGGLG
jgi:hypothetical protein